MVFWLEFFEQATKQDTPDTENINVINVDFENPAAEVQREFEFFMHFKQYIATFRNCLKFMIIANKDERDNTLKAMNMDESSYLKYRIKLPQTAEDLIAMYGAYPIGLSIIHKYLYRIVENDSFKLLHIIDSISERLYFSLVDAKMAAAWLNDDGLVEIIEYIQQLYGMCQHIYNYHKKNNWSEFREDYDTVDFEQEVFTTDQDMHRLDPLSDK